MKKCDPLGVTPIRGGGLVFGVRGVEWVVKVVGVRRGGGWSCMLD